MAKPIIETVATFDATLEHSISFTFSAFQIVKIQGIVKNNDTGVVVYDQTQTSWQARFTIPQGTLINGVSYNIVIRCFDVNNNASDYSSAILFMCRSTPVISIDNLVSGQEISTASYELVLNYSQAQNDILNSYIVKLYNSGRSQIYSSGTIYDTTSLKYVISNLSNLQAYYVEVLVETVNKMTASTGLVNFTVKYIAPEMWYALELNNVPETGSVRAKSNLLILDGISNPSSPTYVDGTKIDLTVPGTYVEYNHGFSLGSDFTIKYVLQNMQNNKFFLKVSNSDVLLTLTYIKATFNGMETAASFIRLSEESAHNHYCANSNYLYNVVSNTSITVFVQKVNGLYTIHATLEV